MAHLCSLPASWPNSAFSLFHTLCVHVCVCVWAGANVCMWTPEFNTECLSQLLSFLNFFLHLFITYLLYSAYDTVLTRMSKTTCVCIYSLLLPSGSEDLYPIVRLAYKSPYLLSHLLLESLDQERHNKVSLSS